MEIQLSSRDMGFLQKHFIVLILSISSSATTVEGHQYRSELINNNVQIVPDYVTRYAPVVWLHSEDPFRPSDFAQHIKHSTPQSDRKAIPGLPELNLDNLEILNTFGGDVALTSIDDVTNLPTWLTGSRPDTFGSIANAIPCAVIMLEKTSRDVDVFYFYFYSYDRGPNITQVLEPLDSLFDLNATQQRMHYGDHVGDWENNMIRFRDGKPTGIYYSQHTDGHAYSWNDPILSKENQRPLVYSAYGSHANYAAAGNHIHDKVLVDYCDDGVRWDPVESAYFYRLGAESFTLTRLFVSPMDIDATSNLTSWFRYSGRWGDMQYPDTDPRQETIPYFKLKRFVSGPTGPRTKQLLRTGLYPDRRHKESWIEWAVGTYMSLYPCCLKGWRLWVSGAVLLVLLVSVVLAVRRGMRRLRSKGYTKVRMEDMPLEDLERLSGRNESP